MRVLVITTIRRYVTAEGPPGYPVLAAAQAAGLPPLQWQGGAAGVGSCWLVRSRALRKGLSPPPRRAGVPLVRDDQKKRCGPVPSDHRALSAVSIIGAITSSSATLARLLRAAARRKSVGALTVGSTCTISAAKPQVSTCAAIRVRAWW